MSLLGILAAVVAMHLVLLLGGLALREWRLLQARKREAQAFSGSTDGPRLSAMVREISGVLDPVVLRTPELIAPSPLIGDPRGDAETAVAFAAERFCFREHIDLHIGSPPDYSSVLGAAMLPQRDWSAVITPETMVFTVGAESAAPREIFLAPAVLTDPMLTQVVAAHEVAHHVLHARGVAGSGHREMEERVEVAMVLAGFFPLMHQLRYVEHRWFGEKTTLGSSIETFGTLSRPALEFVRGLRQDGGA